MPRIRSTTPLLTTGGFIALGIALLTSPLAAQENGDSTRSTDRWQVTLPNSEYVWDIQLVGLRGDSLVYRRADSTGTVPVDQITEIRLIQKTEMAVGGSAGGAMAALTGSGDEIHDFMALDLAERITALKEILRAHPPQKP
ncbi:MAG: hypothetical protein ABJD11_01840 [Gemmatimonadota bacterium]